ncbi:MAG: acyl carrier protein [Chthoniobacterales bacterium]|nr:acyl carrier protein [Chthoniobacterales bacterium]
MSVHPNDESLKLFLIEILSSEILETPPGFDEHSNLFDAGLDSLGTMQLLVRIEQRFGIQIPAGKLTKENSSTIQQLTLLIADSAGKEVPLNSIREKVSL